MCGWLAGLTLLLSFLPILDYFTEIRLSLVLVVITFLIMIIKVSGSLWDEEAIYSYILISNPIGGIVHSKYGFVSNSNPSKKVYTILCIPSTQPIVLSRGSFEKRFLDLYIANANTSLQRNIKVESPRGNYHQAVIKKTMCKRTKSPRRAENM